MGRQESLRMPHHSNLECFLRRTTPTVRSQFLPKSCIQNGSLNGQQLKYFVLGDLWDCYDEWSAFGLGSPILLNTGETAVQYYTPSLSAIEIYTSNSLTSRCMAEEYDGESETTFSSSESEGRIFSRSSSDISDKTLELEEWGNDMGGYWSTNDRLGQLYFQYIENEKPYRREPLFKKINELAKNYPGLKTFKSVDLSPASWISVAWYPIYVIPTLINPKQAFASFLTYHTITSLSQDNFSAIMGKDACCDEFGKGEVSDKEDSNYTSLPPCGLATYKLQSKVWVNPETADRKRIASLLSGAESWSKQPQFHHHDYEYFRAFSM